MGYSVVVTERNRLIEAIICFVCNGREASHRAKAHRCNWIFLNADAKETNNWDNYTFRGRVLEYNPPNKYSYPTFTLPSTCTFVFEIEPEPGATRLVT
ncbi:hypothetical protein V6N11_015267 [Hibiscus sabdariffa]|uniref:S-protein homolog n=1 Tax=Hibiscus sabdariffa TaxID=183260 RepID=A0ABR2TS21_9ROSI